MFIAGKFDKMHFFIFFLFFSVFVQMYFAVNVKVTSQYFCLKSHPKLNDVHILFEVVEVVISIVSVSVSGDFLVNFQAKMFVVVLNMST